MSNLIKHAEREFEVLGWEDAPINNEMKKNIMELLEVFSKQGHSGFSANYCLGLFGILARFEPIGPITGKDSEWVEVAKGLWQNIRCSHVFKEEDGKAYDINAVVFRSKDGCCFTNKDSRRFIEFPYTPNTEYVDAPEE
jgi:hypothetical protein